MKNISFGDTPVSRCVYYRLVCGLAANIDPPGSERIIFLAGSTGALTMPGTLGSVLRQHMQRHRVAVGPIVAHVGSNRWSFLIRPDVPDDDTRVFNDLFRLNVMIVREGAIPLPSPTAEPGGGSRRWIELPRNMFRPSGRVVVEAIRACTGINRDPRSLAVHRG
ncbi:DNA-directed RNA polymerase subunit beta [Nocardia sp. XZ_19_369]|uniref:DNA-directed RNA polymerase subunit beta n=1 Tax=Nocardia sp. XZ_19_369 TaxID=2769487 RepID=UPI00188F7103|nr:DNA-directed RNA polymerase subunit beta [Nocardia sp. XZ_19_369]